MTEQEWLECTDSWAMLRFLEQWAVSGQHRGRVSGRKLRLFSIACFIRLQGRPWSDGPLTWQRAVAIAFKFADGQATSEQVIAAASPRWRVAHPLVWEAVRGYVYRGANMMM